MKILWKCQECEFTTTDEFVPQPAGPVISHSRDTWKEGKGGHRLGMAEAYPRGVIFDQLHERMYKTEVAYR